MAKTIDNSNSVLRCSPRPWAHYSYIRLCTKKRESTKSVQLFRREEHLIRVSLTACAGL